MAGHPRRHILRSLLRGKFQTMKTMDMEIICLPEIRGRLILSCPVRNGYFQQGSWRRLTEGNLRNGPRKSAEARSKLEDQPASRSASIVTGRRDSVQRGLIL